MYYLQALAAFVLWGVFPLYWKFLKHVPAKEIVCHRILWSLLTLVLCVTWFRQWGEVRDAVKQPKRIAMATVAALLISCNWLVFIWAVLNGAMVDSSLGYFMTPLFSMILGLVIFRERLQGLQWVAVALVVIGLAISSTASEKLWVSVALATSFSLYGVVKKETKLSAVAGLGLETAILAPIASLYLGGAFETTNGNYTSSTWLLLALGGPITTLPLLLFASASKHVPLVVMGMFQYVGPTIQFLLGVLVDGEKVNPWRLTGFICVWLALGLFTVYEYQRSLAKKSE